MPLGLAAPRTPARPLQVSKSQHAPPPSKKNSRFGELVRRAKNLYCEPLPHTLPGSATLSQLKLLPPSTSRLTRPSSKVSARAGVDSARPAMTVHISSRFIRRSPRDRVTQYRRPDFRIEVELARTRA